MKRKTKYCLLIAMLTTAVPCFTQDTHRVSEPRILMHSSPDNPVAGSTWTLTLLIDHHEPEEVEVMAPHFTGSLFLDQVNKILRFINPATGQSYNNRLDEFMPAVFEQWTLMEYRFLLSSPGIVSFEAFTVITPQGQTETAPFDLRVLQPQGTAEMQNYRLAWEGIPSNLKTGETAILSLRVNGWNFINSLPDSELFLPPIPQGHILESLPLVPEERAAGIALKLRFIPLAASPLVMERRQIAHNGVAFEIPALRIPVQAANNAAAENKAAPEKTAPVLLFPAFETAIRDYPDLNQKRRTECETIYTAAQKLWESGSRANALAALRQNERDHPEGRLFAALRREAETVLGFTGTNDEKRKLLPFFRDKTRCAVLRETTVRQIPDRDGEEIARFREGQPVLLSEKTHSKWLWVIANDNNGISGWVPEENIIFY